MAVLGFAEDEWSNLQLVDTLGTFESGTLLQIALAKDGVLLRILSSLSKEISKERNQIPP